MRLSTGALIGALTTLLTVTSVAAQDNPAMWLILLEALGAGLILVAIVWWTMFSGRRGGERVDPPDDPPDDPPQR